MLDRLIKGAGQEEGRGGIILYNIFDIFAAIFFLGSGKYAVRIFSHASPFSHSFPPVFFPRLPRLFPVSTHQPHFFVTDWNLSENSGRKI